MFFHGENRSFSDLRHPGLDPGSTAALKSWTPDQVRGDGSKECPLPVECRHSCQIGSEWSEGGGGSGRSSLSVRVERGRDIHRRGASPEGHLDFARCERSWAACRQSVPVIAARSATDDRHGVESGRSRLPRHPRESGNPVRGRPKPALAPRFRGDGEARRRAAAIGGMRAWSRPLPPCTRPANASQLYVNVKVKHLREDSSP